MVIGVNRRGVSNQGWSFENQTLRKKQPGSKTYEQQSSSGWWAGSFRWWWPAPSAACASARPRPRAKRNQSILSNQSPGNDQSKSSHSRHQHGLHLLDSPLHFDLGAVLGVLALDQHVQVVLQVLPVGSAATRVLLLRKPNRPSPWCTYCSRFRTVVTFCRSRTEPLPRIIILQPVSCSSCLAVMPRGPRIRPTKLYCVKLNCQIGETHSQKQAILRDNRAPECRSSPRATSHRPRGAANATEAGCSASSGQSSLAPC